MDAPDAVTLKPPERLLRVVRFPWRSELLQQGPESGLRLTKGYFGLPALPEAEGVEDQERLVRGTLLALLPDAQVVETLEDTFGAHEFASSPSQRDPLSRAEILSEVCRVIGERGRVSAPSLPHRPRTPGADATGLVNGSAWAICLASTYPARIITRLAKLYAYPLS